MTDQAREAWVERARAVRIEDEAARRRLRLVGKIDRCGPCPKCGGDDRFSINTKKQVFHCRGCGVGGDVIQFVEFLDDSSFMEACQTLAGPPPPKDSGNGHDRTADRSGRVVVAQYEYRTAEGNLAFIVDRLEYRKADGSPVLTKEGKRKKTFSQRRPDPDRPGEWLWNVDGVPVLPYRLPEILRAVASGSRILIVEGEAKADLLGEWDIPATCCAGGASKWRSEHSNYLLAADVLLLADNDEAGRKHAIAVAKALQNIAVSIRTLELPGLPPKGDIIDWARNGGTAEKLHALIEREAKPWTPQPDEPRAPQYSDEALALRFAEHHADDLRFLAFRAKWLFWDGCRWQVDGTLRAFDHARAICRQHAEQCQSARTAAALASAKTVAAVERLAKADRRIAATSDQWDVDPDVFNTPTRGDESP